MAAISPFRERSAQALSLAHEIVNSFWGRGLWRSGGRADDSEWRPQGFLAGPRSSKADTRLASREIEVSWPTKP